VAKVRRAKKSSPARSGGAARRRTAALQTFIEGKPGATASTLAMASGKIPVALLHKIKGKLFAIQSLRGDEYVILKCDPNLVQALRQQYKGVGHRSHLDKRFWIAVDLNADVSSREVRKFVDHSYGLVRSSLTRKQQTELAAGA
jgi:predicted DNA-binding protein (MmcQ/YjbR family)